jgi:hypothetical protein
MMKMTLWGYCRKVLGATCLCVALLLFFAPWVEVRYYRTEEFSGVGSAILSLLFAGLGVRGGEVHEYHQVLVSTATQSGFGACMLGSNPSLLVMAYALALVASIVLELLPPRDIAWRVAYVLTCGGAVILLVFVLESGLPLTRVPPPRGSEAEVHYTSWLHLSIVALVAALVIRRLDVRRDQRESLGGQAGESGDKRQATESGTDFSRLPSDPGGS